MRHSNIKRSKSWVGPADVYYTLVRTGTIKDSDITGQRTVVLADGSQSKLPTFTIRSLRVGDKIIENVNASVLPLEGPPASILPEAACVSLS